MSVQVTSELRRMFRNGVIGEEELSACLENL